MQFTMLRSHTLLPGLIVENFTLNFFEINVRFGEFGLLEQVLTQRLEFDKSGQLKAVPLDGSWHMGSWDRESVKVHRFNVYRRF